MLLYKHSKAMENMEKNPTFKKNKTSLLKITQERLELKMPH